MISTRMGRVFLRARAAAPLGFLLLAASCVSTIDDVSGEDGQISCDIPAFAFHATDDGTERVCWKYAPDANPGTLPTQPCPVLKGTIVSACPTRNALGTCSQTGWAATYYAEHGLTAEAAAEQCAALANNGAVWTAAEP